MCPLLHWQDATGPWRRREASIHGLKSVPDTFSLPRKYFVVDDDAGVDYAIMEIPDYIAKLIEGNVVPFHRLSWDSAPDSMDFYAVLGSPRDLGVVTSGRDGSTGKISFSVEPVLSFADQVNGDDYGVRPTTEQQFVAKLGPVNSGVAVPGMSGGPILGFKKQDGELRYWPVAIQGSWIKSKRVIIGTPLKSIDEMIEDAQRRIGAGGI